MVLYMICIDLRRISRLCNFCIFRKRFEEGAQYAAALDYELFGVRFYLLFCVDVKVSPLHWGKDIFWGWWEQGAEEKFWI
jgi:hypothetical protein